MNLRYLSLFSGIEAATEAWHPLGWECVGVSEIEPFPCGLLAQRHPLVPNLGDVTKITEPDIINLGRIDLVVFGSPCFTAGHTVLTARGLVPIESVAVGDNVWTHASRWKRVSNVMTRTAPTVVVKGQGHSAIRATPDHPFYATNTRRTWNGNGYTRSLAEPEWVRAESMTGKRWATPINLKCDDAAPDVLSSIDGAYLAGLYLGDGHIGRTTGRDKKSVILSVGDAKRDTILPVLRKAWGTVSALQHGVSVTRLQLSRTSVADALVHDFGEYSHAKHIPVWALCAERAWQEAFLQGVLDTDGSAFGSGYRVTTVSRALAVGLRLICAQLGYSTSLYFDKRPETCVIEGRTVNQRDTWTVTLRKGNRTSELRTAEHAWGLVRSVTPAADDTVYDITVEDDHSFICDGIVVHNCQDLSVAGKRKGLDGARSGLFFTAMRIVGWVRKHCGGRFALWENVPGAFSSNKGLDFAAVVDELAGVVGTPVPPKGWGNEGCAVGEEAMVEWATLDAQWAGVAQRRRRVFALADFGDWASRPPILLEPQGMRGDSPPSREAGEGATYDVAPCLTSSGRGVERTGDTRGQDPIVAVAERRPDDASAGVGQQLAGRHTEQRPVLKTPASIPPIAMCLNAGGQGRYDAETETFVVTGSREVAGSLTSSYGKQPDSSDTALGPTLAILAFNSNAQPDEMRFDPELSAALTCSQNSAVCFTGDITHALNTANNGKGSSEDGTGRGVPTIVFTLQHAQIGRIDSAGPQGKGWQADVAFTQDSRTSADAVVYGAQVRRLTPRECERLQGFPDDHTLVLSRGKPAADGPRYKALGNSMAVPVMGWIGRQIDFAWRFF